MTGTILLEFNHCEMMLRLLCDLLGNEGIYIVGMLLSAAVEVVFCIFIP